MKFQSCRIVLIVLVAAGAASAQDRTAEESNSRVVLEGCLRRAATPNVAGSSPSSTTTSAVGDDARTLPSLFLLTDARPTGRTAATAGAGTSVGTAGQARTRNADGSVTTEPDGQPPKTYALFGDSRELAAHGGHRVEVSGTIVRSPVAAGERGTDRATSDRQPPASGAPGAVSPNPATTPDPPTGPVLAERLNVTSIRTVADACAP